jgi:hypothetical protein
MKKVKVVPKVEALVNSNDVAITARLTKFESDLAIVAARLERKIAGLVAELEVADGALAISDYNIGWALNSADNLKAAAAEAGYASVVAEFVGDYDQVVVRAKELYSLIAPNQPWTRVNSGTLHALQQMDVEYFTTLGDFTMQEIHKELYQHVLSGSTFKEMSESIGAAVTNPKHARYAATYAQDAIMGFNATLDQMVMGGDTAQAFYYAGTLMKTSRKFCIDRVGKRYTRGQIEAWQGLKWQGKAPGSVFTVRGGYNCRHRLLPVPVGWGADEGVEAGKDNPVD